jgi:hypothetical protein
VVFCEPGHEQHADRLRRPDPREVREENDSVEGRVDGFVVPQFDSSNLRRRVVAG